MEEKKIDLREYFEKLLGEIDRRYEQKFSDTKIAIDAALIAADKAGASALASQKEAVTKAEVAAEKRFEAVNEFRATLADQQRNLMPRVEAELQTKNLADRIDKLETKMAGYEGSKQGVSQGWGWAVAAVSFVITIVTVVSKFAI